jgi:hypothetical protein
LATQIPALSDLAAEFAFFRDEWQQRNQIMANKVASTARKHLSKRIVVLCGSEHRYILRELLSRQDAVCLKEFYEVGHATQ